VSDHAIAALRLLVDAGGGPLPGFAPWRVVIARGDGCATFDVRRGQDSAVLCAVAWTAEGAAEAWSALEKVYLDISDALAPVAPESVLQMPACPESLPWLSVIILPAGLMLTSREDLGWLGDFERCLAWTIIEA